MKIFILIFYKIVYKFYSIGLNFMVYNKNCILKYRIKM